MSNNDNFEEEINKEIQEGFIKQIADKIVQGMASLNNATEDVKRRWIWELLQNAKDVPNKFGGVSVIVELHKDRLLFKHNGDCFTIKNLTSLIQQVSSKDDQGKDPNVTGKFGTGFITTHLLSRIFTIYGVAKSHTNCCKKFKMVVDRNATHSFDMIKKIKIALDELRDLKSKETVENYEENRTEDDMDTVFEYPLNDETYDSADVGVKDLLNVLPYSLLFIPLLKKVTVFIHSQKGYQKFLVQKKGEIQGDGIEIITISKEEQIYENEQIFKTKTEDTTFIMNSKGRLNVVWPISQKDGITRIQRTPVNLPKLFCSFPLIGSENFYQPMVINSGEFYPNEPRNTIFLRNFHSIEVKKNRELLIQANYLFNELVEYAINHKFEDFFNLFTGMPIDNPYIDHRWVVDSTYTPRIKTLLSQPLVKTMTGTTAPIKSMFFPKAGTPALRKELWMLYRKYFHDNIVIEQELEKWYEVLCETQYAKSIDKFIEEIAAAKCLANMTQFEDDQSRIVFLNELISFIKKSGEKDPKSKVSLSKNAIIPNIKGVFKSHNELRSDREKNIPEEVKTIYSTLFNRSLNDILIHHSIRLPLRPFQNYKTNDVLNDINGQLSTIKDKELKEQISLMITELVPIYEVDESSPRLKIIRYLNDLQFNVNKKTLDDLPVDVWRNSDPVVFEMMLEKLIFFGKSKEPTPVALLSKTIGRNIDETMEWMNDYIVFMKDNNFSKVLSSPIIPRQDSFFGVSTYVYIDDNIPQTIKNILSNGNYDIYSQLMDKRITCFPGHQKMDMTKIADEIIHQIDMSDPVSVRKGRNIYIQPKKNPADVYEITIKLICLQSESGNQIRKEFFDLIEPIDYTELINQIRPIQLKEEIISDFNLQGLEKCINQATRFLAKYIIQELTRKGDIKEIKNIFKSSFLQDKDENFIVNWYSNFLHFMHKSHQFHRELVTEKIYLNQNGKFISQEASIDDVNEEELLEIATNNLINYDVKGMCVIPQIEDVLDGVYNGMAKRITRENVGKRIDDKIKQYQGNKQDGTFVSLILKLRDLFIKDEKYKALFPYTSQQMEQLILNTLNSDILSSIVTIVSEGKTDVLTNLKKYDSQQIDQLMEIMDGNENVNKSLNTIRSLSDNDQQYINDHPGMLSRLIRNQRESEEMQRQIEMARQDRLRRLRELQERSNRYRPPPTVPIYQRPTFSSIHQYTHAINIPRHEIMVPPPPPQKSYEERLIKAIKSLLRTIFKKVKYDEPNTYYCSLVDDNASEEDQDLDEYLIIPMITDKGHNLCLNGSTIEFITVFPDTVIIFIVPPENDFNEESFENDLKIISSIGSDLEEYNIVEGVGQLISIDTDYFAFKGCENYFVQVKNNYIEEHQRTFEEWSCRFKVTEEGEEKEE
ncbi:hypothetical protein M9Y10_002688 [Tritrichomonas musculus]|uniref:Histidine kinase/HSP90-like ATPase domain-containing protein n=1 Tax=Tritrichomonas musculus TaxID=1915356 RepID=A0ABR2LBH7_9EUKA